MFFGKDDFLTFLAMDPLSEEYNKLKLIDFFASDFQISTCF